MDNCNCNIELISMLIDGELEEKRASELRAHIDQCKTCKKVLDAFLSISDSLCEGLVEPPEMLAKGIMFKVSLMEKGKSSRPFAFGRFTAIAACLAIILFGAFHLNGRVAAPMSAKSVAEEAGNQEMAAFETPAEESDKGSALLGESFFDNLKLNLNRDEEEDAIVPTDSGCVTQFGFGTAALENTDNIQTKENDFLLFLSGLVKYADENNCTNGEEGFAFYREDNQQNSPVELRIYEGQYNAPEDIIKNKNTEKDEPESLVSFTDLKNLRAMYRLFKEAEETDRTFDNDSSYTVAVFTQDGKLLKEEKVTTMHIWLVDENIYFKTSPDAKIMCSVCKAEDMTKLLDSIKEMSE